MTVSYTHLDVYKRQSARLAGNKLMQPIASPVTGELLAEAGKMLTREKAYEIEQAGVSEMCIRDRRTLNP